jgi:hypothetical protein
MPDEYPKFIEMALFSGYHYGLKNLTVYAPMPLS